MWSLFHNSCSSALRYLLIPHGNRCCCIESNLCYQYNSQRRLHQISIYTISSGIIEDESCWFWRFVGPGSSSNLETFLNDGNRLNIYKIMILNRYYQFIRNGPLSRVNIFSTFWLGIFFYLWWLKSYLIIKSFIKLQKKNYFEF